MEKRYTKNKRFGVAIDGNLAVFAYPSRWEPHEFQEWLELLEELSKAWRGIGEMPTSLLVFANGQGLSAKERGELSRRVAAPDDAPPMRQALLTDSAVLRGVLTAVGWIMNKPDYELKPFAPHDWREAMRWLQKTATFDIEHAHTALVELMLATGSTADVLRRSAQRG